MTTPRYIQTSGALVPSTDGLGNPCGDWVKAADYERDLAAREAELAEVKRDLAASVVKSAEFEAENSKLRSALEIVHFKREPWQ